MVPDQYYQLSKHVESNAASDIPQFLHFQHQLKETQEPLVLSEKYSPFFSFFFSEFGLNLTVAFNEQEYGAVTDDLSTNIQQKYAFRT